MIERQNFSQNTPATRIPEHDARDLTGNDGLAQIKLDDQVYVLRITRAGKLILTK
ncbi:hemin uptake protein HemP [Lutimaribacter sp. EGI FJ00015]|uniref:Hemin uptake protein HemP n=1 Tax=Lutimaribacter degradans TaxID=2945989 RepID=A0ACC5ZTG9_9RHOB|nr:hemin uptake protein HemP [Lutimaribacter sp. EGI FJ00013]MCM2561622.1 hemin uptake protein HemP [Lutimaribacter sp. EGI FJ00013]MCO0612667.1 hemin uptake protein HemP [Lutimaribacter sp. EGI FJ00015]MCO0635325.1 hemin uptake protein HemP [Lutimaribacter sp. EGI FJ00014]